MKSVTILDIKRAIPKHLFESSLSRSMFFTGRALFLAAALAVGFYHCQLLIVENTAAWIVLFSCYLYFQGLVFWGFFTIGHDCGHGAFSRYPLVNWILGNFLHSLILVPYEPWRLSHRSHHKNTCNMDKEEIFYPNEAWHHKVFFWTLGGAWFLYILFKNVSGRRSYTAYFKKNEFVPVALQLWASLLSLVAVGCILWTATRVHGFSTMVIYYFAPVLVFACWLVVVTFLHHNDNSCPWYTEESWTILRGSLSAVDRDYGWLVNSISHHIHLHQIHHLFPMIPHYHLAEATAAFRCAFPALARVRQGSIVAAFLLAARDWLFTRDARADSDGVFMYAK